ncbi:MAG: hypothetical protein WCO18_02280 [bacterium]
MKIEWNKVTWYTRLISYLLLLVIFSIGFYFGGLYQDLVQITSNVVNPVKVPRVYTNKYLGFSITFPISWSGVGIQEDKKNNDVDFSLMHNLGGRVKVFSIRRFSLTEWSAAQKSLHPTIKIKESGEYIFGYILGQDDEGFVGFPDVVYGTLYKGPYFDVQTKIIPSFNLLTQ